MSDGDRFEDDLRARFRALREADVRQAPPFLRPRTERPVRKQRRLLPSPAWRGALAAMAVVALVIFTWVVHSARQEGEARRMLARWRQVSASTRDMPTDFLLDTSCQSLLHEVPRLGEWETRWLADVPTRDGG